MPLEVPTALVTASGAAIVGAISYGFTKQYKRETELRRGKLERHKDFVAGLNGAIEPPRDP